MKKLGCILLIEDNEFINIYNKKIIEKLGIAQRIEIIDDGRQGLDYLTKQVTETGSAPDLIFLDINMPKMNGWEFIEEYTRLDAEKLANTKIVILSTSPNPDDVKKYSNFPCILCFEKKPLTKEKIRRIITKFFN